MILTTEHFLAGRSESLYWPEKPVRVLVIQGNIKYSISYVVHFYIATGVDG